MADAVPTTRYLLGVYADDDQLFEGVKAIRSRGIQVDDVFSPFPLHGMDKLLGLKESRLPTVAFAAGTVGFLIALSMQSYMLGFDWPMNISGKPHLPFPSFIPILFELTVLVASLGMVGVYFFRNQMKPGPKRIADLRQTDDRFVVALNTTTTKAEDLQTARELFQQTGAVDIRETELDTKYELKDDFDHA